MNRLYSTTDIFITNNIKYLYQCNVAGLVKNNAYDLETTYYLETTSLASKRSAQALRMSVANVTVTWSICFDSLWLQYIVGQR